MGLFKKEDNLIISMGKETVRLQQETAMLRAKLQDVQDDIWGIKNPPMYDVGYEYKDLIVINVNVISSEGVRFWEYAVFDKSKKRNYFVNEENLTKKIKIMNLDLEDWN